MLFHGKKDKREKPHKHRICCVLEGSIAEQTEIEPGDFLITINNKNVTDVFDYRYAITSEKLTLLIEKADGEEWEIDIEKDETQDIGLVFEEGLMDTYHSCRNQCIFCFIDQMPPGMRSTLYFKDDDARLSFLQGNYITLTGLNEEDMEHILLYKLSPINISIHTMNPELRVKMLGNRFAGEALKKMDRLCAGNIEINGQIVLCKGVNDGEELEYTLEKLQDYMPHLKSVSVVPVGLTKFREGLAKLQSFSKEDAKKVLRQIEGWQQMYLYRFGKRVVYASDEWYFLAEEAIPAGDAYEDYPQLENGVGMVRNLTDEVEAYLETIPQDDIRRSCAIATGELIAPVIRELADKIMCKFPETQITVHTIINHYFGERITVAGLLTGKDIMEQLAGKVVGVPLLLTERMFREQEEVLLDDITKEELERALQTKVRIVKSEGACFVKEILGQK